jgi:hypothetical protein
VNPHPSNIYLNKIYETQNIPSSIQGYLLLVLTGIKNAPRIKYLTSYWLSVAFRHTAGLLHLQVLQSSTSSLFSPPFPHFISGLPFIFLPIRQGQYLPKLFSHMRNTCP